MITSTTPITVYLLISLLLPSSIFVCASPAPAPNPNPEPAPEPVPSDTAPGVLGRSLSNKLKPRLYCIHDSILQGLTEVGEPAREFCSRYLDVGCPVTVTVAGAKVTDVKIVATTEEVVRVTRTEEIIVTASPSILGKRHHVDPPFSPPPLSFPPPHLPSDPFPTDLFPTKALPIPIYVAEYASESVRISSACSCLITPPPRPTTTVYRVETVDVDDTLTLRPTTIIETTFLTSTVRLSPSPHTTSTSIESTSNNGGESGSTRSHIGTSTAPPSSSTSSSHSPFGTHSSTSSSTTPSSTHHSTTSSSVLSTSSLKPATNSSSSSSVASSHSSSSSSHPISSTSVHPSSTSTSTSTSLHPSSTLSSSSTSHSANITTITTTITTHPLSTTATTHPLTSSTNSTTRITTLTSSSAFPTTTSTSNSTTGNCTTPLNGCVLASTLITYYSITSASQCQPLCVANPSCLSYQIGTLSDGVTVAYCEIMDVGPNEAYDAVGTQNEEAYCDDFWVYARNCPWVVGKP